MTMFCGMRKYLFTNFLLTPFRTSKDEKFTQKSNRKIFGENFQENTSQKGAAKMAKIVGQNWPKLSAKNGQDCRHSTHPYVYTGSISGAIFDWVSCLEIVI